MNRDAVRTAFESLDEPATPAFRNALHATLLAQLARGVDVGDQSETIVEVGRGAVERRKTGFPTIGPRSRLLLGLAAALLLAVSITVLVVRSPDSPGSDHQRDLVIADSSLLPVAQLGMYWGTIDEPRMVNYTWPVLTEVARKVPACARYMDAAFDVPQRVAAISGKKFSSPKGGAVWEWVWVFPTEKQADRFMDAVAEPGYRTCFVGFYEAGTAIVTDYTADATIEGTPQLRPHGDRQVAFTTVAHLEGPGGSVSGASINVFVRVGRAVLYLNPDPDFHQDNDPNGIVDRALTLAIDTLKAALKH